MKAIYRSYDYYFNMISKYVKRFAEILFFICLKLIFRRKTFTIVVRKNT